MTCLEHREVLKSEKKTGNTTTEVIKIIMARSFTVADQL